MEKKRQLRAGENFFAWLMLGLSGFILIQAYLISGFSSIDSPGTFPMGAAVVMAIASIAVLIKNRSLKKPRVDSLRKELQLAAARVLPTVFIVYALMIIGYMILIEPLHFLPSSFGFMFLSILYLKGAKPLKSLVVTTVMLAAIYIIFQYFFRVVLP